MVGLDSNVLVRFVTRDDVEHWNSVDAYLSENCSSQDPGWISCIVLCEVVWVLSSGYDYSKQDIINFLRQLLLTSELKIEEHDTVRFALKEFEKGKADFSNYLIGQLNKHRGCETTVTFDKKAAQHTSFFLIKGQI